MWTGCCGGWRRTVVMVPCPKVMAAGPYLPSALLWSAASSPAVSRYLCPPKRFLFGRETAWSVYARSLLFDLWEVQAPMGGPTKAKILCWGNDLDGVCFCIWALQLPSSLMRAWRSSPLLAHGTIFFYLPSGAGAAHAHLEDPKYLHGACRTYRRRLSCWKGSLDTVLRCMWQLW